MKDLIFRLPCSHWIKLLFSFQTLSLLAGLFLVSSCASDEQLVFDKSSLCPQGITANYVSRSDAVEFPKAYLGGTVIGKCFMRNSQGLTVETRFNIGSVKWNGGYVVNPDDDRKAWSTVLTKKANEVSYLSVQSHGGSDHKYVITLSFSTDSVYKINGKEFPSIIITEHWLHVNEPEYKQNYSMEFIKLDDGDFLLASIKDLDFTDDENARRRGRVNIRLTNFQYDNVADGSAVKKSA